MIREDVFSGRFIGFAVCCLVCLMCLGESPANAQRIFRASPVDVEQDQRIDAIEAKVSRIETSVAEIVTLVKTQSATTTVAVSTPTKTAKSVARKNTPEYKVGDDITVSNGDVNTVIRIGEVDGMIAYFTAAKASPKPPQQQTVSYQPSRSRSHWTYPGDIKSHLASGHGNVNTAGMTRDQMESLHDDLHEGRSRPAARPAVQPVASSGCPGGVCPTSSRSVQRTGIFGWRR